MAERRVKHITRGRKLTPEEAARYRGIREEIEREKPQINSRHRARMANLAAIRQTLGELKRLRQEQGLSLADLRDRTGMDRAALSKLENGQRDNPTLDTVVRYAQALGKKVVLSLADADRANESPEHAA